LETIGASKDFSTTYLLKLPLSYSAVFQVFAIELIASNLFVRMLVITAMNLKYARKPG
jgi:hypothetical protein